VLEIEIAIDDADQFIHRLRRVIETSV
jgi:hypothetical protein